MVSLALSRGIVRLDAAILETLHTTKANPAAMGAALSTLEDVVNSQAAAPQAHALHLGGGYFNELSGKQCKRIMKGVRDLHLGKWLEAALESTPKLFPSDVESVMQASQARLTH